MAWLPDASDYTIVARLNPTIEFADKKLTHGNAAPVFASRRARSIARWKDATRAMTS